MKSFDNTFTDKIVQDLEAKLDRPLTKKELGVFKKERSGIAYEMILDYINDEDKNKEEIEQYVKNVIKE